MWQFEFALDFFIFASLWIGNNYHNWLSKWIHFEHKYFLLRWTILKIRSKTVFSFQRIYFGDLLYPGILILMSGHYYDFPHWSLRFSVFFFIFGNKETKVKVWDKQNFFLSHKKYFLSDSNYEFPFTCIVLLMSGKQCNLQKKFKRTHCNTCAPLPVLEVLCCGKKNESHKPHLKLQPHNSQFIDSP